MKQVSRYHPALVALHWGLAFFIIAALALGALKMAPLSNADPKKIEALRAHMSGGILILLLMSLRLLIRVLSTRPAPASTGNDILNQIGRLSHRAFYVLVFAMVGSGLFMAIQTGVIGIVAGAHPPVPPDFWVFPIRTVHYVVSRLLMALITLHVIAVIYHMFVLKDGLLFRMAFGRRTKPADGDIEMNVLARISPWLSRLVLLFVTVLLATIGLKFIFNPAGAASASSILLQSPVGLTNMRAGFGAFPLACAVVTLICLVSPRRRVMGLSFVAILIGIVLIVRIFGILHDGTLHDNQRVLTAESVVVFASACALFVERLASWRGLTRPSRMPVVSSPPDRQMS